MGGNIMKYAGHAIYILVLKGEILEASTDEDYVNDRAYDMNASSFNSAMADAGYDPEEIDDIDDEDYAFLAEYAYVEEVYIPDEDETDENGKLITEDTEFCTSEEDTFTYGDVIYAIDTTIVEEEEEEY